MNGGITMIRMRINPETILHRIAARTGLSDQARKIYDELSKFTNDKGVVKNGVLDKHIDKLASRISIVPPMEDSNG
jgi:hypothetical protein